MDLYNPDKISMCDGCRTEKGKSLHYYLMNDDDVGIYSLLKMVLVHKHSIQCHCCIFHDDS